jgi:hypothetical protein
MHNWRGESETGEELREGRRASAARVVRVVSKIAISKA